MKKNWKHISLGRDAALREAMTSLDQSALQIVLIMDDDCHLAGTLTDGDIRRALLRGKGLDAPVSEAMNTNPTTGLVAEGREIWQRTMRRNELLHLPLLDANGCITDFVRYTPPAEPERDTPVIIMAGGMGARLRPLTYDTPKSLIKVGSKPVLETIIENFAEQGFRNITLCINYKGEMIRKYFADGKAWGVNLNYVEEPDRMGTSGALTLLENKPEQPFIVMNGDLLTKVDFVRLLDFHDKQAFSATVAMREHNHQIPYGVLEIDDDYKITRMEEKPVKRHYISAGIYVLNPEVLTHIPAKKYFDMPMLINLLMDKNNVVGSFPLRDYWIDIGRMEDLEQASNEFRDMFG